MRIPFPRGRRWSCTIKQNWRNGRRMRMEMGWWNASLSTQTQTVRGMNEHSTHWANSLGHAGGKGEVVPFLTESLFSFSFPLCGGIIYHILKLFITLTVEPPNFPALLELIRILPPPTGWPKVAKWLVSCQVLKKWRWRSGSNIEKTCCIWEKWINKHSWSQTISGQDTPSFLKVFQLIWAAPAADGLPQDSPLAVAKVQSWKVGGQDTCGINCLDK